MNASELAIVRLSAKVHTVWSVFVGLIARASQIQANEVR